ncbi:MAG: DEAD/DEAH box helicase [Deltaproteobacteria bacterium]|nr:DEAD/DEAH box helicase [Deltaproteobacteria bacterium]
MAFRHPQADSAASRTSVMEGSDEELRDLTARARDFLDEGHDVRELLASLATRFPNDFEVNVLAAFAEILHGAPVGALGYYRPELAPRISGGRERADDMEVARYVALALMGRSEEVAKEVLAVREGSLRFRVAVVRNEGALGAKIGPALSSIGRELARLHRLGSRRPGAARRPKQAKAKPNTKTRVSRVDREKARESEIAAAARAKAEELCGLTETLPALESRCRPLVRAEGRIDPPELGELRGLLVELRLLREFGDLLCLPQLHGVDAYDYQIETVKKVLKDLRGRALLADEVGLGKTIEAGMALKEYVLRGMVTRTLILVPAPLVTQWKLELESKFDLDFATTSDPELRADPDAFWKKSRIIASIATARREEHATRLAELTFDMVIVDEAHRLKNRTTAGYRLVDRLKRKFLLLLSATPVQNDLIELYNLLTLLKPGIFETERSFRAKHVDAKSERTPLDPRALRDLMRDVMVRNTRAVVGVRLPSRQVMTIRPDPSPEESAAYEALVTALKAHAADPKKRMSMSALLLAAGSCPEAARESLSSATTEFAEARRLYGRVTESAKEGTLIELLTKNRTEKKLVFTQHRATLRALAQRIERAGIPVAVYEGSLTGPKKDEAIRQLRDGEVEVLVLTDSGGEGHNLQFANTLINFDLPWNPMRVEQRIGRIHRIGQTREVFVFNLATKNTVEDRLLHVLDEKLAMFELVVGEIGDVLGELDEDKDFATMVFDAWLSATDWTNPFHELEARLLEAKRRRKDAAAFDDAVFGDELAV